MQFLKSGRIGLLKMNIEGQEKDLLASRRMDTLLGLANIAIIEAHDRKQAGTSDIVLAAAGRSGMHQIDRRGAFHVFMGSYNS
jgi:hypothetical protein